MDINAKYALAHMEWYAEQYGGMGEIRYYHDLLRATDHIPNKLIEAPTEAERDALRITCADILAARAEARRKINELEAGQE